MNEERVCSKCGMTIPDCSSVCGFCGTPYEVNQEFNNSQNISNTAQQQTNYAYGTQQQNVYGTVQQSGYDNNNETVQPAGYDYSNGTAQQSSYDYGNGATQQSSYGYSNGTAQQSGYSDQAQQSSYNSTDNNGYVNTGYTDTSVNSSKGKSSKGFAITSLVLSILSLLTCCIPGLGFVFGLAALIFAIISRAKKQDGKGMSIAAIIISIVSAVAAIIIWICMFFSGSSLSDLINSNISNGGSSLGGSSSVFSSNITEMNVVRVNGNEYSLPVALTSVDETMQDEFIDKIATDGVLSGEYVGAYFDSNNGTYIYWAYVDNYGASTEYDYTKLYLSTIDADYCYDDSGYENDSDIEVYGGIKIGSSYSEVNDVFGSYGLSNANTDEENEYEVYTDTMYFSFYFDDYNEVNEIYAEYLGN